MAGKSLYERLGGSAGIDRLVESILALHMENPEIRARFLPYLETPKRLAELKGLLATFLEAGSGGPRPYTGRTMRDSHRGLNISEAEYLAATDDIMRALARHDIDQQTQGEVLSLVYSMRKEIARL